MAGRDVFARTAAAFGIVRRVAGAAAVAASAGMVALFGFTVWQRYVAGAPSSWSDELCAILFLWVVFGGAALVVPYREQIAIGLLYDGQRPFTRRWMEAAGAGAAGLILLATLPVTLDYIAFLWRERTPALRWQLNHVYLVFGLFQGLVGVQLLFRALAAAAGHPLATGDAGPVA